MNKTMTEQEYRAVCAEVRRMVGTLTNKQGLGPVLGRGEVTRERFTMSGFEVSSRDRSDYLCQMIYLVRDHRVERRKVDGMTVVEQRIHQAKLLAEGGLHSITATKHASVWVRCSTAYMGVKLRASGAGWMMTLGPNWKGRVYDRGIAIAQSTAGPVFVMKADPRSSYFLSQEGVTAYEVVTYQPSVTGRIQSGFVFKSAGPTGGSDFVVFHEDFMKGVALLRRRITRGVMDALLGEET